MSFTHALPQHRTQRLSPNLLQPLARALVALVSVITLLAGLSAGLARLGWPTGSLSQNWLLLHGPLMICGFLGTLICLERAVALATRWPWSLAVPLVNGAGALALLVLGDTLPAKLLLTLGSVGLVVLLGGLLWLHPARYMAVMGLGALSWLTGNLLWLLGAPVFQTVHWWTAFLILTIVGERLELARVRRLPGRVEAALVAAVGIYLAGVLLTVFHLDGGIRLLGLGALLMAGWLLRYDIARRTLHGKGLARYIAACLLVGYGWLGFGGLIGLWHGALVAGPDYAALLHAFLLGFVFSMIFGHAPIILPAVTGLRLDYHPIFYGHLLLLHSTLAYRMVGMLGHMPPAQRWGGLLNGMAVLLFLGVTLAAIVRTNLRANLLAAAHDRPQPLPTIPPVGKTTPTAAQTPTVKETLV